MLVANACRMGGSQTRLFGLLPALWADGGPFSTGDHMGGFRVSGGLLDRGRLSTILCHNILDGLSSPWD